MDKILCDFFNARIERKIFDIPEDTTAEVKYNIRNGRRKRVILNPEAELFLILRQELESEVADAGHWTECSNTFLEAVAAAQEYLKMRQKRTGLSASQLVPGWCVREECTGAEVPKLLAYFGSRILTVSGGWRTKKFRKCIHRMKYDA